MTLRRTIAAALREGAARAVSGVITSSLRLPPDVGERRVIAAARVAFIARIVADLLDPDGHAAAARVHDHAHERTAAASASGGADLVEPVAAGAVEAQAEQRSTGPAIDARVRGRDLHMRVDADEAYRFVKGGRA